MVMSRVEAMLFLIGAGVFLHGLWSLSPAAAEIAGGLFLVACAAPKGKEGAKG